MLSKVKILKEPRCHGRKYVSTHILTAVIFDNETFYTVVELEGTDKLRSCS